MDVYIFKTNVEKEAEALSISSQIEKFLPVNDVHFDLDDCDRVLRIEALDITNAQVEFLLTKLGFACEAL